MGVAVARLPRWLGHGLLLGILALGVSYGLTFGTGLDRPSGCGSYTNSYFPGAELLLLTLVLLGGAAGWWTARTGGSLKEAALAGLVVGAVAGILPLFAVSSSVPSPPPGCAQVPAFVRDNYSSIAMQTRISALLEMAALGLIGGLAGGRSFRRRQAP
jgi:hypothetical protein